MHSPFTRCLPAETRHGLHFTLIKLMLVDHHTEDILGSVVVSLCVCVCVRVSKLSKSLVSSSGTVLLSLIAKTTVTL